MEDKRLREKIHSQDLEKLRFTKADREDVFRRLHHPEKKRSRPKAFVPAAVSVLMIGICLLLFFPSLLAGKNESDPAVATDPVTPAKEFSTVLITLKSEAMDNRSYVNVLLAYSEQEKQVNFISLPNGMRMPFGEADDGTAMFDKLLFSYRSGGAKGMQEQVAEWASMPIDRHAVIDLGTFSKFIESTEDIEYNFEKDMQLRGITRAAVEFDAGEQRLDGQGVAALMIAATEGTELEEAEMLPLLGILIERIKNGAAAGGLDGWFADIETDSSPDDFLAALGEIETMKMIPLAEGMIPSVGELNGVEGQHYMAFEEEFLQSALNQLTNFDPEGDGCTMQAMKKLAYAGAISLLLAGCGNDTVMDEAPETAGEEPVEMEDGQAEEVSTETDQDDEAPDEETETGDAEDTDGETDASALSAYSSESIEYARVWLQLGANQEIDGLYVTKIPAGTPLNPDDETSAVYPEDVIQLAGSRLVDGSVTYSGNGNGTIDVYNVPLRWDGQYPAGESFYQGLIDNTELVPIDVGADEDVIRLIELLK